MAAEFVTGVDIGAFSIKGVVLSHRGKTPKLVSFGSIVAPQPGIASDTDADLMAEAKAIKNLILALKSPTSSVVIALPESKIFTRIITDLPFLSDDEIASAIKYSAEEFVPLPVDQVNLYWQIIARSKQQNNTQVFVVASPKTTVSKYLKVLQLAKLTPIALETELIAATRSIIGNNDFAPTTLIVQLGASSTDFAIISKGMMLTTRSIATGSMALTRAICQYLNFEVSQAEEYKKVYGLLEDQLGGKIYQSLKPLVDIIASETERVVQSFQMRNPQNLVKRIVLTGGGAKLPGIVTYFANSLGLEVQEADPWFSIEKDKSIQSKLFTNGVDYTVAIGLAMRGE
ncbi:MAG: type IV pilus assembly protein PilM [Candidatus Daviesbacteria bacterium]